VNRGFVIGLCLLFALSAAAKNVKPVTTPEQEQQFLYYFYAARQAIMVKDYPKALVLLDFCEQLNPYDGKTKDNLGVIYIALGDSVKAGQLFEEAYRYAPNDCWRNYADYLMTRGEVQKGEKVLEQVTKRNPKDNYAAEYLLDVYIHNGKWKKALAQQDKIDALEGYNGQSALNRYRIYMEWRKPKQAVAEIDKYLEQDPESLYFLVLRARIYLSAEAYSGVQMTCMRIALLSPFDEQDMSILRSETVVLYGVCAALVEFADTLLKNTPSPESIATAFGYYEQALALMPQSTFVLNNYAYSLAIHGNDLSKAERMSALTIQAQPNNASYLDTYGWILHLQGQDALALFYLRKALENVTAEDAEARRVIEEHIEVITHPVRPAWQRAHVTMTLNLQTGGQAMKVNCVAQTVRDSLIIVSVMPLMNIEMFRIELTPDEAVVIDKMNKRYSRVALDLLPNIHWSELQQLMSAEGKESGDELTFDEQLAMLGIRASAKATFTNIVYDGAMNARKLRLDKYEQVPLNTLFGL